MALMAQLKLAVQHNIRLKVYQFSEVLPGFMTVVAVLGYKCLNVLDIRPDEKVLGILH